MSRRLTSPFFASGRCVAITSPPWLPSSLPSVVGNRRVGEPFTAESVDLAVVMKIKLRLPQPAPDVCQVVLFDRFGETVVGYVDTPQDRVFLKGTTFCLRSE